MDISIKCDSLKAIYSVKKGMLRCVAPYEFTISQAISIPHREKAFKAEPLTMWH